MKRKIINTSIIQIKLYQFESINMDTNTVISLCVKTGVWGITIDPKLGAKQCFLSWKLIITLSLWIILDVLFAWILGQTFVDMIVTATPETICQLYFLFMLIFGAAGCIYFLGISAPSIGLHFNNPSESVEIFSESPNCTQ